MRTFKFRTNLEEVKMGLLKALRQSVDIINRQFGGREHQLAFVLGSGIGPVVEQLTGAISLTFNEAGLVEPGVSGHEGKLFSAPLDTGYALWLAGRPHLYEGYDPAQVVFNVRVVAQLASGMVILTNAAGGIRADLKVGDVMVIRDHLNLTGRNPLVGQDSLEIGPRFPDMTEPYDPLIAQALHEAAGELFGGEALPTGVYAGMLGPNYETPAEVRMLRALGADAVGMSTVLEAIALRQMGARVGGLSIISNAAAAEGGEEIDHAHVKDVAGRIIPQVGKLLMRAGAHLIAELS